MQPATHLKQKSERAVLGDERCFAHALLLTDTGHQQLLSLCKISDKASRKLTVWHKIQLRGHLVRLHEDNRARRRKRKRRNGVSLASWKNTRQFLRISLRTVRQSLDRVDFLSRKIKICEKIAIIPWGVASRRRVLQTVRGCTAWSVRRTCGGHDG